MLPLATIMLFCLAFSSSRTGVAAETVGQCAASGVDANLGGPPPRKLSDLTPAEKMRITNAQKALTPRKGLPPPPLTDAQKLAVGTTDMVVARSYYKPAFDKLVASGFSQEDAKKVLDAGVEGERKAIIQRKQVAYQPPKPPGPVRRLINSLTGKNSLGFDKDQALANYEATGEEVLNPDGKQAQKAKRISVSDLFLPRYQGDLDYLITHEIFTDEKETYANARLAGGSGAKMWWPFARLGEGSVKVRGAPDLVEKYGGDNVRSTVYWMGNKVKTLNAHGDSGESFSSQGYADMSRSRIRVNEVKVNGVWQKESLEAFGLDQKGEFVPFYYVLRDGKWVSSETFQGKPVKQACLECHPAPGNSGAISPLPNQLGRRPVEYLQSIGYPSQEAQDFIRVFGH